MARQYQKHLNNKRNWLSVVFSGLTCQLLLSTPASAAFCSSGGSLGMGLLLQVNGVEPDPMVGVLAYVGDTLTLSDFSVSLGASSCNSSNGWLWVAYPDNHIEAVMANFNLPGFGQLFAYSDTHPSDPSAQPITLNWVVKESDLGPKTIFITTNIPQTTADYSFTCSGTTDSNHLIFVLGAQAQNGSLYNFPSGGGIALVTVLTPVPLQITTDGTNVTLLFQTQTNATYYAQATDTLNPAHWTVITNLTERMAQQRFYRVGMIAN